MVDWRVPRTVARRLVVERDTHARAQMPKLRRAPLDEAEIGREMPYAVAERAFWVDLQTMRPLEEAIAGATLGQILAYCVPYSHADICNGGFHQYYWNHTGDYAALTVDALRTLGDHERVALFVRSMARFPDGIAPRSRAERIAALDAIPYR
ncbi:MAG: DUF4375 domain-containing protein, partial [Deltaproteobacteria bacterium]|nr:DUF4375 domain-containing protein [Deltaproteobacteria bacterium]